MRKTGRFPTGFRKLPPNPEFLEISEKKHLQNNRKQGRIAIGTETAKAMILRRFFPWQ